MAVMTSVSIYLKKLSPTVTVYSYDSGNLSDQFSNLATIVRDCLKDFRRQAILTINEYPFENLTYEFNFKTSHTPGGSTQKFATITFSGDTHVEHIRLIMLAIMNCGIDCMLH